MYLHTHPCLYLAVSLQLPWPKKTGGNLIPSFVKIYMVKLKILFALWGPNIDSCELLDV